MTVTNQFAAHGGLDWADKKHDVCVQFKNGERVFHVIEHFRALFCIRSQTL